MVERVFVHIGAPKTGTTYLQAALGLNRGRLKEAGVLYPRGSADAHHTAVWDLREMWAQRENSPRIRGAWGRTVEKVRAWEGPVALLSSELFVYADKRQARTALTAFGDAEVHVVYTARDLVRQVPAVWQERLKNQRTMPYEEFVADVIGRSRSGMAKGFWNAQDAPTALQRWAQGIPSDRVHVVTTPPSGAPPDQLWDRFMSLLGLDGAAYRVEVPTVNASMGAVEAEVLRGLNQRHAQDIGPVTYRRLFRTGLFDVLGNVAADQVKIVLAPDEHNALVERGRAMAAALEATGYDIVGDLDELVPEPVDRSDATASARRPADVTQREVIHTLQDVVFALLEERRDRLEAEAARRRRRRRRSPAADNPATGNPATGNPAVEDEDGENPAVEDTEPRSG